MSDHIDPNNKMAVVTAKSPSGEIKEFETQIRIDTPKERDYFEHGGILQFVLRQIVSSK